MAKINTLNYQTVAAWNGSQDLFVVEQQDGTKVATPAQIKQYVLGSSIDDVYSVMGQMGAKNLIPYPYYSESGYSNQGMTITYDADGVFTINKVAGTATAYYRIATLNFLKPSTKYRLVFEVENATSISIFLQKPTTGDYVTINNKSSGIFVAEFETTADSQISSRAIGLSCTASDTETNATVKVMLVYASDTDNTYQPYAKTNKELTEVIGDLSETGLTGDSVADQLGDAKEEIGDLSQTTVTGDTVAAQLKSIKNVITFDKVPDSFITLQSGISIVTNQVYKQGNHVFGWITFGFSAQTPSALKLGVLNSGYRPSGISRMMVGLGTQPWTSEYVGYCLRDSDYSLGVTGYNSNIRAAHIHFDYVIA